MLNTTLQRIVAFALLFSPTATVHASVVSYDTSSWDHGSGNQTGWNDGELSGTTTVDGVSLTVSSSRFGTAAYTADHLSRINETFFTGFAFQLDPATTDQNSGSLTNYARIDFSFSDFVSLDNYTLTDVDRTNSNWFDVVAVEGFTSSTPGAVGSGTGASYSFESPTNMQTDTLLGLFAARPRSNTGNVQNTAPNDVNVSVASPIQSFSLYYWNFNNTDSTANTQTIGTRGNQFSVSSITVVPEPKLGIVLVSGFIMTVASRRRRQRCSIV